MHLYAFQGLCYTCHSYTHLVVPAVMCCTAHDPFTMLYVSCRLTLHHPEAKLAIHAAPGCSDIQCVTVCLQIQNTSLEAKLTHAERQLSALKTQLAVALESADAASEAADRIPALESQLRRSDARLAASNSQLSSLQHRLSHADDQLAESQQAAISLQSQLDEVLMAQEMAQHPLLALPAAAQQGGVKRKQTSDSAEQAEWRR